ncbi:MAG: DMT family transporter [Hyphomicrobiaceae bacterium]
MSETMIVSAALATIASVLFGIQVHLQNAGFDYVDARAGALINIGATTTFMWLLAPFFFQPEMLVLQPVVLFALAGLLAPAISLSLMTKSVQLIGPSLSSGLGSASPVFAIVLAVVLLGEVLTSRIAVGTAIVMSGVMLVAFRVRGTPKRWPLWALALPIAAAMMRGGAHALYKLALAGLPDPMTGVLITVSVAFIAILFVFLLQGRSIPSLNLGYAWFGASGVINAVGMLCFIKALAIGQVVTVSPIVAAAPVFTLLTGSLIFRREYVGWKTGASVMLIVAGCLVILVR